MKVLALTTEPISAQSLRDALAVDTDPTEIEVMVVAPALHSSALRFWVSDADEAIEKAEAVRRQSVDRLGDQGVAASGDTGEGDLADAVEDALKTFAADRIVVFAHPQGEQLYKESVDDSGAARNASACRWIEAEVSVSSD